MCKNYMRCIGMPLLGCIVLFSSCKYSAITKYYNDPQQYVDVWELSGVRDSQEEKNTIFPKNLNDLNTVTFFCRYDQQYPLGEGVQILLEIKYFSDELFQKEFDKLSQQCFCVEDYFIDADKVFAVRFGEDDAIEYAMINEAEQLIAYVYIQSLPKDQIELDSKFIPTGYYDYSKVQRKE